ncbi:MAG: glycosyltransferase [Candidatus Korarchaeum sp.]
MPKAYISPLGIGYGHASRCVNLAKRLVKEGFSVYFSARGDAFTYLKGSPEGFPLFGEGKEIVWKQREDGSPDFWGTLKEPGILREFVAQVLEERDYLEAVSPDVVISDSRLQTLVASEYLGLPSVSILNQPKLLLHPLIVKKSTSTLPRGLSIAKRLESVVNSAITRFWALSQASLVADFPPPFNISKYQTSNLPKALMDRLVFTGPLLEPECDEVRDELVLIMISGPEYERRSVLGEIIALMERIPEELRELEFVVSMGEPGTLRVEELSSNVKIFSWLPNKWEFLSRARVVVSRAGHNVISESLLCGKPLLLIPVPGQTEKMENAKSVQELGLGLYMNQDDLEKRFFDYLRTLLKNSGFHKRAKEFRDKFLDWDFLGRAVGAIESVIA